MGDDNQAYEKIWEKIMKLEEIIEEETYIEMGDRTSVFCYIDDTFYIADNYHNECISQYLNTIGEEKIKGTLFYPEWQRIEINEIEELEKRLNQGMVMFVGHIIEKGTELNSEFIKDEDAIYIQNIPQWMRNVSLEEAAHIVKNHKDFKNYNVYEDGKWTVDTKTVKRNYTKL